MLEIKKNYFFYSFSFSFYLFPFFYHTSSQKSANLMGETDSTAKFTLWTPWTATSQTPWIRSYTPSLATISTYHLSPLSFTYHTPYTTFSTLHNQHNNILHTPYTYNNIYIQQQLSTHNYMVMYTYMQVSCNLMQPHALSCNLMQPHADPMQAVMQSHVLSTPILLILLSITHLIQGLSYFSSLYTPFLLTGCAYT